MTRVLVVDNYDSFVYTLNGYLLQLGADTTVLRNDAFSVDDAPQVIREYDAVLLSPGPGTPAAAGVSIPIVRAVLESGEVPEEGKPNRPLPFIVVVVDELADLIAGCWPASAAPCSRPRSVCCPVANAAPSSAAIWDRPK